MNEKEFVNYRQKCECLSSALLDMGKLCTEINLLDESEKMKDMSEQLLQHRFSVGVMGEFRRGKSTVINSLLGEKVMPSDIRPCSATMNRVTYGQEKKAVINMRDGRCKDISIEELPKYVTKLEEYNDMAAAVDEAIVYYPSHFCKDGVDIIDTPGLNDDERMNKVSQEIVPKLDVMIMTLIPDSPFSISEARFVRDTLLTEDLSKMIFLVNKIDSVDEDDREILLSETQKRIREKTLDEMKNLIGEDSDIYKNACKVLDNISLYPLSALKSLTGKRKNKPALVEESGAIEFENALTEILTQDRALLELGHAVNILSSAANKVQTELCSRIDALDISAAELQQKQDELKLAKQEILEEENNKIKELDINEEKLKNNLIKEATSYYGEMQEDLKKMVDDRASEWDMSQLSKVEYQAMVAGQLQEKIKDEIGELIKAFSVRIIKEMESIVGEDTKNITEFTQEVAKTMYTIVHSGKNKEKVMDMVDVLGTAVDVVTDYMGLFGIGGIIAGARAAGVKGGLVGGGVALATSIGLIVALPMVGLPLAIVSCAAGTLAGKFATKTIFKKDIAEKKRKELVNSLKKSVEDTIKQLSEEKHLEKWIEEQVMSAYQNLRTVMTGECQKLINEATNSLKELDNIRRTELQEHEQKKEEFMLQQKECEKILSGIDFVVEWIEKQSGSLKSSN